MKSIPDRRGGGGGPWHPREAGTIRAPFLGAGGGGGGGGGGGDGVAPSSSAPAPDLSTTDSVNAINGIAPFTQTTRSRKFTCNAIGASAVGPNKTVQGGGGWHKASVSDCVPLAAPIGLSPLLILTLCGPERVLVVSMEPPDDVSCLTTAGVGRPGDGLLPVPLTRGGVRNCPNLVRRQLGTKSLMPLKHSGQNSRTHAYAVNGGGHFLRAVGCLLVSRGGLEAAKAPPSSKLRGHKGDVHAKSAGNDTSKTATDPQMR